MKIPFTNLGRVYESHSTAFLSEADRIWSSGLIYNHEVVSEFENNIKQYAQSKYCISVASGTDALIIALRSFGIGYGDDVITSPYSYIATANAVKNTGANPIFCDVNPDTLMLAPENLHEVLTANTKAIVPVHLFGQPYHAQSELVKYAKEHNLYIIEDNAQSFGACKMFGHAAAYSFDPMKTLGSFGPGGAIVTNNSDAAKQAFCLRRQGLQKGVCIEAGYNTRLPSLEAALLRIRLENFEADLQRRREIANTWIRQLSGRCHIVGRTCRDNTWHKFVLLCNNRDQIQQWLQEHGIETKIHYDPIIPLHPAYIDVQGSWRTAQNQSKFALSLPIYAELTDSEIEYISNKLTKLS